MYEVRAMTADERQLYAETVAMLDFIRYMDYVDNCERDLIEWRMSRPLRFVTEREPSTAIEGSQFLEEEEKRCR